MRKFLTNIDKKNYRYYNISNDKNNKEKRNEKEVSRFIIVNAISTFCT